MNVPSSIAEFSGSVIWVGDVVLGCTSVVVVFSEDEAEGSSQVYGGTQAQG